MKNKKTIGFSILALFIICFMGWIIYDQSRKILLAKKRPHVEQNAQLNQKKAHTHSHNSHQNNKIFQVKGIVVPIHFTENSDKRNKSNLKEITFDFTMLASTPHVSSYFEHKNTHLIQDRIKSTRALTLKNFPLEEEKRQIIKDKVKQEFNTLLKELKMNGTIREVYIDRIIYLNPKKAHAHSHNIHQDNKTFQVKGIVIPIYFTENTDKGHLKEIIFDFTILASTPRIKPYFKHKNMYLIRDRINSTLALPLKGFPFEKQRKQTIKDKVKQKFNNLLKELKMNGTIREVYIDRIVHPNNKIFQVTGIVIPIHFTENTDKSSLKKIIFDFTIHASAPHIKSYFEYKKIYLIQDKINSTLAPTLRGFPLEEEGKQVIKDKVKQELNTLLKERNMNGTIQEVHIDHILAA